MPSDRLIEPENTYCDPLKRILQNTEEVVQRCSVKKCFLKFHKIHKKTPVPESLFKKVAGLKPAILLKKGLWNRCFPVNFVKFLRKSFL